MVNEIDRTNAKLVDHIRFYRLIKFSLKSVLNFGKYKGKTIDEIIKIDFSYFNYCLKDVGFFCVENELIEAIKLKNPLLPIINEAIVSNSEKYFKWIEQEKNYNFKMKIRAQEEMFSDYAYIVDDDEPEDWNGKDKIIHDTNMTLFEFAVDIEAYSANLYEKEGQFFIDLNKGKDNSNNTKILKTLLVRGVLKENKLSSLKVLMQNDKYFAVDKGFSLKHPFQ